MEIESLASSNDAFVLSAESIDVIKLEKPFFIWLRPVLSSLGIRLVSVGVRLLFFKVEVEEDDDDDTLFVLTPASPWADFVRVFDSVSDGMLNLILDFGSAKNSTPSCLIGDGDSMELNGFIRVPPSSEKLPCCQA